MESMFVPKFSGHLIGIKPVYVLCQLLLANDFVDIIVAAKFDLCKSFANLMRT